MKIGIIGCGEIAATHLNALQTVVPAAGLCLCDREHERAETLAATFKASSTYKDMATLLSRERPDTVHITTPFGQHAELAKMALDSGCHVYIEKPVAESAAAYDALMALAKKRDRILCPGYSALAMPAVQEARRLIHSGDFGRVVTLHCDYICAWPGSVIPYGRHDHWAYSLPGGILRNMADHPASLVVDALDHISQYHVLSGSKNILPNNCLDLLHVSMAGHDQVGSFTLHMGMGASRWQINYNLEGGTLSVDLGRQLVSAIRGKGPENSIRKSVAGAMTGYDHAFGTIRNAWRVVSGSLHRNPGIFNLIDNFYSTIAGRQNPLVTEKTARATPLLLEKIWQTIPDDNGAKAPTT